MLERDKEKREPLDYFSPLFGACLTAAASRNQSGANDLQNGSLIDQAEELYGEVSHRRLEAVKP
jgi:hypothetical protein